MQVNIEWLRDWVEIDVDADRLAEQLTMAGLEVDAVTAAGESFDGVVVAHVTELRPHPNAERLSLASVDNGSGTVEVVCGAPNVEVGIRVPFAQVGAVLPGGQRIKKAKLRGIESQGMLCSARELGLADDAEGLLILDEDAPIGEPLQAHLKLDDAIVDIDLTPNRGDCFSVIGVAREIAAAGGQPLELPERAPVDAVSKESFPVKLGAPAACARFAGRVVKNITTGRRTPDWMRERLRRAGIRAIHPVVDITNYVMLEYGQPLHAYNLDKLTKQIDVRMAAAGEALVLLDGARIELDNDVLVIADAAGAIGLAGIMGGESTAVDENTHNVFLESAFFAAEAILGRARRYGLHTDASVRFERGVDFAQQERAIERATQLLMQICGGEPGPTQLVETKTHVPEVAEVELSLERANALLGVELAPEEIESLLGRLSMQLERDGSKWRVRPPSYRFDIAIEEDLIEEIGRMVGYDNLPVQAGSSAAHLGAASEKELGDETLADVLVARGFAEVVTYSFVDEQVQRHLHPDTDPIRLLNPMSSDMGVMRRSLWAGLLDVARRNLNRQRSRLRIFEIGPQFLQAEGASPWQISMLAGLVSGALWPGHWGEEGREVDFFDLKGDLEALLDKTGRRDEFRILAGAHPGLQPGQSAKISLAGETAGWMGKLHPRIQQELGIKQDVFLFTLNLNRVLQARVPRYRAYSKFPFVRRDVAVLVDEDIPVTELIDRAESAAGELLQSIEIFDLYTGEGVESKQKSVGLGLILQSASRTLTDEDADRTVDSVTQCLERELGATIRN